MSESRNMTIKAFTYFDPVPAITPSDEAQLILLWMDNWRLHGFEPVVLNAWHAIQHPFYAAYYDAVSKLPSINPAGYDLACYLRWLAVANSMNEGELAIMLDYDVFNYGLKLLPGRMDYSKLNILDHSGVPGAVLGTSEQFFQQAERFYSYQPTPHDQINGQAHCSDMTILRGAQNPKVNVLDIIREYTDPGWEQAQLVHYSNQKTGAVRPRWKYIAQLRPT